VSASTGERRGEQRSVPLIILGSVVGLLALAMLAGGGTLLWADQTQRDSDGYFTSTAHHVVDGSYAITHHGVKVEHLPGWLDEGKVARIRITATGDSGQPLFMGIAHERDAKAYLAGVAHSNLRDFDVSTSDQEYDSVGGTARPQAPASQHIWVASTTSSHATSVNWRLHEGNWSIVLMNADGSKGVAADVKVGADFGYLGWLSSGLLVIGTLLGALAVFFVTRRGPTREDMAPAPVSVSV
jgi:hypothetical protein